MGTVEQGGTCMIVCQRCKGNMRIPDYEENGVLEDDMMPCPECEGEGTVYPDSELI